MTGRRLDDLGVTGGTTTMVFLLSQKKRWNDNDGWEDSDDGWTPAPTDYNQNRKTVERRQVKSGFRDFLGGLVRDFRNRRRWGGV